MRIVFIANDGRQFDNQWECEAYEEQQKIAAYNLKSRFFDENRFLMDITDLTRCVEYGWYIEPPWKKTLSPSMPKKMSGCPLRRFPPQVGRFYFTPERRMAAY